MNVDVEKLIEEIELHAKLYSEERHSRIIAQMPMSTVLSTVAEILEGYKERIDESERSELLHRRFRWRGCVGCYFRENDSAVTISKNGTTHVWHRGWIKQHADEIDWRD